MERRDLKKKKLLADVSQYKRKLHQVNRTLAACCGASGSNAARGVSVESCSWMLVGAVEQLCERRTQCRAILVNNSVVRES